MPIVSLGSDIANSQVQLGKLKDWNDSFVKNIKSIHHYIFMYIIQVTVHR